jgi:hypothetical protein
VRRYASAIAVTALLLAGGFAAASIASGEGLRLLQTTATTSTTSHKVTICHRTHSKKKKFHTISVDSHAVAAHLRHGDTLGACTSTTSTSKKKGKNSTGSNTSSTPGHGNGNGNGNGNGKKK